MSDLEAVATAVVPPSEALVRLRALLAEARGPAVAEAAETAYETLRSVVWQHVSSRSGGDEPRAWADVVLRIRQSLRHAGSPVAERLTVLYDMLDQTVRYRELADVRGAATGHNVDAILAHLKAHGGTSSRAAIAEATGLRSSNLSRILSNMCADGLVDRATRGREVDVSLAAEGRRRVGRIEEVHPRMPAEALVSGAAARVTVGELWADTGCALAVANREGVLVSCDASFAGLFGAAPSALEGLTREQVRLRFEDVSEELGHDAMEVRTSDGRTLRMTYCASTNGALWAGVDVTPYREAISALRARCQELVREGRRREYHARHSSRETASGRWALEVLMHHGPKLISNINEVNSCAELMREQAFGPIFSNAYVSYATEIAAQSRQIRDFIRDIVRVASIRDEGPDVREQVFAHRLMEDALSREAGSLLDSDVKVSLAPERAPPVMANVRAVNAIVAQMVHGLPAVAHPGAVVVLGSQIVGGNLIFRGMAARGFRTLKGGASFATVCRGIADAYGGEFHIAPSPGDGLVTTLALPIATAAGDVTG